MSATEPNFKDFFDGELVLDIARRVAWLDRAFDHDAFVAQIGDLGSLPMKSRVKRISDALHAGIADPYPQALSTVVRAFSSIPRHNMGEIRGFPTWVATQFVETHGLDHFESSMSALHVLTQQFTAEFAVRPFLVSYPERTLEVMRGWASDPSPDVRRLVSEGTRPRLPWGLRLHAFVKDPTPVLALIAPLAIDPSEYVRRSVANNLNDIAKDHPDPVVDFCTRLLEANAGSGDCGALVRHACRTLIKQGHGGALRLQGYSEEHAVAVGTFRVAPDEVNLGDSVHIEVELRGDSKRDTKIVIDYAIHFQKKSGVFRKVFKWSSRNLAAGQSVGIAKRHPILPVTIRTYYPGTHRVELLINGKSMAQASFELRA